MRLTVLPEEAGIKLLDFLARRLDAHTPRAHLHRWIRSGQLRVNKGRAAPFTRLAAQDEIRLPPFACPLAAPGASAPQDPAPGQALGPGLRVIAADATVLALEKAAGLVVHGGTGHSVSAAGILADFFHGAPYIPAPAHRLDKDSSGILLAGRTHAQQRALHALLCGSADDACMVKEYLVWVPGLWPHAAPYRLQDQLARGRAADGRERMLTTESGSGRFACATVLACLLSRHTASLLHLRLHTGRTHQIRVQLATRGFPVYGDRKYQGPAAPRLMLHACRVRLPDGRAFLSRPDWPAPFAVPEELAPVLQESVGL